MLNIVKGKQYKPVKMVLYGVEGIGKTTLAAQAPNPLFIDTENGSAFLDVPRIVPETWSELISSVKEIAVSDVCSTLILDTADWAETACISELCAEKHVTGLEDFGYGKGYTYLSEKFSELFPALDACIAHGINVIVTAHALQRKVELPDETGAFDHYEMKLSKRVSPMLREWCDVLAFANYKTVVEKAQNNTFKASGAKRTLYFTHNACWDAKNRFNLPDDAPMEWETIASIFTSPREPDALDAKLSEINATNAEIEPLIKRQMSKGLTMTQARQEIINNWDATYEWLLKRRAK